MDQEQKPPSFLDDSAFDEQFSPLEQGLRRRPAGTNNDQSAPNAPASPTSSKQPDTATGPAPSSIFPESAFTRLQAPRAVRPIDAPRADELRPPESTSDRPRPLLELFPPPPLAERKAAAWTGQSTPDTPPPRAVRRPSASKFETPAQAVAPTYEPFYGLSEKPFTLSTDPKFMFRSASHERALKDLIGPVGGRDGVMVLTGALGTGRTTLCRALVDQLGRQTIVCFVTQSVASFEQLLKVALVDFGVVAAEEAARGGLAKATRAELTAALTGFAASLATTEKTALIVIDDAQHVPADVLEPLAALTAAGERRLQLLLVGTPALRSRLSIPDLQALQRAVAGWCQLEPLSPEETAGYVARRLAIAGVKPGVEFDANASAALHTITGGVPRLINLLCDRALTIGFARSAPVITEAMIAEAASDLDLIPQEAESPGSPRKSVVAVVVVASLLAGAGAAAWVFRADLDRLIALWKP